jgi:hypothetical protein
MGGKRLWKAVKENERNMTEKNLATLARAMDLLYNYLRVNFIGRVLR